jgi:dipeptidyl aminopeptidase/acylaminoacyl peptidase
VNPSRRRVLQLGAATPLGATAPALWAQAAASPPPASLFFSNPVFTGAQLSPAGTRLALTIGSADHRDRLAVMDLATLKSEVIAAHNLGDVAGFRWVSEQRLVYAMGDRRSELTQKTWYPVLFAVNADGSRHRDLQGSRWMQWLGVEPGETEHVHLVRWDAQDFGRPFRLDTRVGVREPAEIESPRFATQWLFDEAGELRAVVTARDGTMALHWRAVGSDTWRKLRDFDRYVGEAFILLAVLPDQRWLVAVRPPGRDTLALTRYEPATDRFDEKPLLAVAGFDVLPHELIRRDGALLGVRFFADAEFTYWFDPAMKALQERIDRALPDTANMVSLPQRGASPWVLLRSFADVQPALYHLFNRDTARLTRLGAERPDVQPARMALTDFVRVKARDGLEIPCLLTLPRTPASAKLDKPRWPLVVLVHGGPWVRGSTWGWDAEAQFLASRGYAVLQPEFRGSEGFGAAHLRAGFKQWGRAMQDDLADAARWAIAQGVADPARVAICGASYGGYAALMGLVKDGDLFKCAVARVAVTDLLLLHDGNWTDVSEPFRRYGLPQLLGDRRADEAMLIAHSPLHQAARIRNPLLLGHGSLDRRVPVEHGRRLRDAVKAHNQQVEWVEYEKEGHSFSFAGNEIDWWQRVERFLARHLA